MTALVSRWLRSWSGFGKRLAVERLHRLFALIIVLQYIQCFRHYWWTETYKVVYFALAVAGVTELMMTRAFAVRLGLQVVAVFAAILWWTPFQWYGWPEHGLRSGEEIWQFIRWHGEQFHPYYEIAVGTLLTLHALAAFGKTRARAIGILIVSIGTLSAIDSFFPLELWRNIAWTVLAGLGWLVVLHFRDLFERHYDSWRALAERPIGTALPAVIVIGLLLLVGMVMPRAPVLLEDPYTLLMKSQGKEVPVFNGEAGDPGVTVGSKGSSVSGYSRNDAQLGGGFNFDYSPVFEVTTTRRSYWRGESKAVYTGKGWKDADSQTSTAVEPGNPGPLPLSVAREGAATELVEQTFQFLDRRALPVVLGAGPIRELKAMQRNDNRPLGWNPDEWELRFAKPTAVKSYTVVSEVPVLDEEALRHMSSRAGLSESTELNKYLQLPDTLPDRVRELAATIVQGKDNDYDKAKALADYLQTNYAYTNQPDLSRKRSADFVDSFLFEIKEGYCDYFSTAFVVMARSVGLPARWVKGYATGYNPQEAERMRFGEPYGSPDPVGAGTYIVRNADAHSWGEVYFEGYGWIPFEPTSGFSLPLPVKSPEVSQPNTLPEATDGGEAEAAPAGASGRGWVPAAIAGAAVLAALAGAGLRLRGMRGRSMKLWWRKMRYRNATPHQQIVKEMESLLAYLQRRGLKRESHETIRETVARWYESGAFSSGDLAEALQYFEKARYSGETGEESAVQAFEQLAGRIRKAV